MERKLIGEIITRQVRFLRHLIRKDGLENLALTGKIEGKRGRGRKRLLRMTSINAWIAERGIRHQEVELIGKAIPVDPQKTEQSIQSIFRTLL